MTGHDQDRETLQKHILDWLNQAGGLVSAIGVFVAALTTVFAILFPNLGIDNQRIAFGIAGLLIIGSVGVYFYRKRRAANLQLAELEPLASSATLRGLLPFEDGDDLPGRIRDVQGLKTLIASSDFRFGVLWGESGSGKTSILRAGLIPKLKNEEFVPLYIARPTKNPVESIRSTLLREFPSLSKLSEKGLNHLLRSAVPTGKKALIILDQFEEFFLTNRTPHSRTSFIKWLGQLIEKENLPVAFLLGIRTDFFAHLQNFAPYIAEPTSTKITYQLHNFDKEQAKQIFGAAAKADAIPFESELIYAIVHDLENDEFIRPAELQVVGTRLKQKNITRLNQYESLGGARGILSSYISDEIKRSPNEQAARTMLRLMCSEIAEAKSPTDLSFDVITREVAESNKTDAPVKPDHIRLILNQFVSARIVIRTEEDKYNLVHDYLASYVLAATEGTETQTERADRLLRRYVAEYRESPEFRIPFDQTFWIRKFASSEIKNQDKAKELIQKSIHRNFAYTASVTTSFILALGLYFFYLTQAYYFSTEYPNYIVLRSGHPQFTFLRGYGEVVIRTGIHRNDLLSTYEVLDSIEQGKVRGFWFQRLDQSEGGYQIWGEQLATRLYVEPRTQMFRWLGKSNDVRSWLVSASDSADFTEKQSAIRPLTMLAATNPEHITHEMLSLPLAVIKEPAASTEDLSRAIGSIRLISINRPDLVSPEVLYQLLEFATDSEQDMDWRKTLIDAVGSMAQDRPELVTSEICSLPLKIMTNQDEHWTVRDRAATLIVTFTETRPEIITPDVFSSYYDEFAKPARLDMRYDLLQAISNFADTQPELITAEIFSTTYEKSVSPETGPSGIDPQATELLKSFIQASPDRVDSEIFQSLYDIALDPATDFGRRSRALSLLESIIEVRPELVSSESVSSLFNLIQVPNTELVTKDLSTLGVLAKSRPELVTPEMFSFYSKLTFESSVQSSALPVLGSLAHARPDLVSRETYSIVSNVIRDSALDLNQTMLSDALETLEILAQVKPELITSETLSLVSNIIVDTTLFDTMRRGALHTFGVLVESRPDLITSDMIYLMLDIIDDPNQDSYLGNEALQTLVLITENKPELITPEVCRSVIEFMIESGYRADGQAALRSIFLSMPQHKTHQIFDSLSEFMLDPNINVDIRSAAGEALAEIPELHPKRITPEMIEALIDLVSDPGLDSTVRYTAGDTLRKYVRANELVITSQIAERLIDNLNVTDDYVTRNLSARTIGPIVRSKPQTLSDERLQVLFDMLTDDQDSAARYVVAYALFEIAFVDADARIIIQEELNDLKASPQPLSRMTAFRILEMLAIGDLASKAKSNPDQLPQIKIRLQYIVDLPASGTSNERENGLSFAAAVALEELDKIAAESQK